MSKKRRTKWREFNLLYMGMWHSVHKPNKGKVDSGMRNFT